MKNFLASIAFVLIAFNADPAAAINIAGINFDENAFADELVSYTGSFNTWSGQLEEALTDKNAASFAYSWSPGSFVQLQFTDNKVVNGDGDDLALFELNVPDSFAIYLTPDGKSITGKTVYTGLKIDGRSLNIATFDLSDFGLNPGEMITELYISTELNTLTTAPSLSLVGAINSSSIPEPEMPSLFGLLLLILVFSHHRKQNKLYQALQNH